MKSIFIRRRREKMARKPSIVIVFHATSNDKKSETSATKNMMRFWQKYAMKQIRNISKKYGASGGSTISISYRTKEKQSHKELMSRLQKLRQQSPKGRAAQQVYDQNRKARKLALPNTLTHAEWLYALQYWQYSCAACGKKHTPNDVIAQDHWIPLNNEECPGTIATNILPLCKGMHGCNNRKGTKDGLCFLIALLGEEEGYKKYQEIQKYFLHVASQSFNQQNV
jgi:hypothetical protein